MRRRFCCLLLVGVNDLREHTHMLRSFSYWLLASSSLGFSSSGFGSVKLADRSSILINMKNSNLDLITRIAGGDGDSSLFPEDGWPGMPEASEIATYADRSKSADRMKQNPHGPSTPVMKPVNRASKRAAARGASGTSRPGGAAFPPTGKRK